MRCCQNRMSLTEVNDNGTIKSVWMCKNCGKMVNKIDPTEDDKLFLKQMNIVWEEETVESN